ncbi:MAG: Na+ dependent nucleoside transporter N-terminal domain-containing protein, partial [Bacteroidales bacterium]
MKNYKPVLLLLIIVITSIFTISAESISAPVDVSSIANGITFNSFIRGLIGIASIIFIAFLFSRNRRAIDWKVVSIGLALEIILATLILYVPFVQSFFELISCAFLKIISFTSAGSEFLFGSLLDVNSIGYIFLFQVIPIIIFFSALTSVLYYLKIIQVVVKGVAWLLNKALKISGAEGLIVAGNIFLGQTEAPMLIKRYLPNMNKSELLLVMSVGMATISGSVLTAYISLLGGADAHTQLLFAKYLLMASVMAAPGVIILAKIVYPQTEPIEGDMKIEKSTDNNLLDAISNGGTEGIKVARS